MKAPSLTGIAVAVGGSLRGVFASNCRTGLEVATSSGLLHGTINATYPSVRQFLGVPYAQAPLGDLRFERPERYRSSANTTHVVEATKPPPSCLQPDLTPEAAAQDQYRALLPEFLPGSPAQSEDCLFLNVYAPSAGDANRPLPVFIWLHGGSWVEGSGHVPYQDPSPWVERSPGHVVVTLNYRLGIFGYPNAAGQKLNVGLLDQRLAVEWVRDNIAAFGGDPDRMVLWGQSAGAWSAQYYAYAYPDEPLVTGLIADSGGVSLFSPGDERNFTAVARQVGCNSTSPEEEIACMKTVDAAELQQAVSRTASVQFQPGPDGVTAFADPAARAADGRVARVPLIVGTNTDEGTSLAKPWTLEDGPSPGGVRASSNSIVCPTAAEIRNRLANGLKTYRYLYGGNFSNVSPVPWLGAMHNAELPMLFGTHSLYGGNSTELEWQVSHTMQDLWLSFASAPNADPSAASFTWPEHKPEDGLVAAFAVDGTVAGVQGGAPIDAICP